MLVKVKQNVFEIFLSDKNDHESLQIVKGQATNEHIRYRIPYVHQLNCICFIRGYIVLGAGKHSFW